MKRIKTLLLAALLLLGASGCTGNGTEKPGAAMGRYVETELQLPEAKIEQIVGLQAQADGTVNLLCYVGGEQSGFQWHQSADGGVTWAETASSELVKRFIAAESNTAFDAACWDEDGRLYVYYFGYSTDESGMVAREDGIAVLDGGTVTKFDWPMPETGDGSMIQSIRVAENGDLLLGGWAEVQQVDRDTGAVKYSYRTKSTENVVDGWDVEGNTLWLSEGGELRSFDLSTGGEGEAIPATASTQSDTEYGSFYRLVGAGGGGGVYFADEHGLYRGLKESSVSEKLIDGSMSSLGIPSVRRMALVVLPERFLFLGYSNEIYHLYSYRYDPDVPTFAANELRVWSLADDPLIRQAIGEFQREHNDVSISYEPAGIEGGAVTRDDALKSLSTELVAGKGPDVLVLDGAPLQSYIDKGVLQDIAPVVKPMLDDGTLLANQAGAYLSGDGTMYAVPALFQVPLLHGDAPEIRSLATVADWAERNKGSFVHPLSIYEIEDLWTFFYPLNPADDEGELRSMLTDLKRIYDVELSRPFEDSMNSALSFQFSALAWKAGNCGLNVGILEQFEYLYPAWQMSEDTGRGSVEFLFGTDGFLPKTVLGASSQSKNPELASDFIKAVLSEPVQASQVGAGMAVNAAAFTRSTQEPEDSALYGHRYSTYGTSFYDAQGADVPLMESIYYPPQAWRDDMARRIRDLKTPLTVDGTVLQLIIDNTGGYFSGRITLDETMKTLMQKLNLYRSEQGK